MAITDSKSLLQISVNNSEFSPMKVITIRRTSKVNIFFNISPPFIIFPGMGEKKSRCKWQTALFENECSFTLYAGISKQLSKLNSFIHYINDGCTD